MIQDIVIALQSAGRFDNTIIIFTSDNGLAWGEHRWLDDKRCIYEECIRVPLWIRIPGQAPRTESSLVQLIDLAPTVAEWAKTSAPAPIKGVTLVNLINSPGLALRSGILLEDLGSRAQVRDGSFHAVRTQQYIYAEFNNGDTELYDLAADPYQLTNIVGDPAYATIVAQMRQFLNALRNS